MSATALARGEALCFPSQQEITAYLAKHSRTRGYQKNGINERVAEVFANSKRWPTSFQVNTLVTVHELKKKLGLSDDDARNITTNLVLALANCARDTRKNLKSAL